MGYRVLRGGYWGDYASFARCAYRYYRQPELRLQPYRVSLCEGALVFALLLLLTSFDQARAAVNFFEKMTWPKATTF